MLLEVGGIGSGMGQAEGGASIHTRGPRKHTQGAAGQDTGFEGRRGRGGATRIELASRAPERATSSNRLSAGRQDGPVRLQIGTLVTRDHQGLPDVTEQPVPSGGEGKQSDRNQDPPLSSRVAISACLR